MINEKEEYIREVEAQDLAAGQPDRHLGQIVQDLWDRQGRGILDKHAIMPNIDVECDRGGFSAGGAQ